MDEFDVDGEVLGAEAGLHVPDVAWREVGVGFYGAGQHTAAERGVAVIGGYVSKPLGFWEGGSAGVS